jgi:biopolymer transport protein ExbD
MNDHPYITFRSRTVEGADEMDMTPMVDVTFLLLIFFMITASFALQRSFHVPTPNRDQPSSNATLEELEEDPDYIVVRVDRYNTYHVAAATWDQEEEAPNEFDLLIKLRKARKDDAQRAARRMLILADGEATYEYVVKAIDAGNEIGVEEIKLVTVESEDWDGR